eukprot:g6571.t1
MQSLLSTCVLLLVAASTARASCPAVSTQPDFNLTEFVGGGTWYAHEQMAITYLPKTWFYCVTATYTFTSSDEIHVANYANKGKVNGVVEQSDKNVPFGGICGSVTNANETAAKLSVGPCKLPQWVPGARGPYWVLAAGPSAAKYDWALISGGQPTHEAAGGCRTGTGINGSGLWIFLRSKTRDEPTVGMVRALAAKQGFDLSVLHNVTHEGCTYNPA